jgi:hypothetical protein
VNYYNDNWKKTLEKKTNRELYVIYKDMSPLNDSVRPLAKKELENRHFDTELINDTNIDWDYTPKPGCSVTIKKSLKYFLITGLNLMILTIMLAIWTDKVELVFYDIVRPLQFFILLCISLLNLVVMRIMVSILRRQNKQSLKKKIILSIIICLILSSFQYYTYSIKIFQNNIKNSEIRQSIESKITFDEPYLFIKDLTFSEYNEIQKLRKFIPLPETSERIYLELYQQPGPFGQDFSIRINFVVPLNEEIETINETDDPGYTKTLTFEIIEEKKHVEYFYGII